MTQVSSSKPERPRPARDERESTPGAVLPWEPGRFFSQLFGHEGGGEERGSSLRAPMTRSDQAQVEAFAEQLVSRLNTTTQWPLQAAFFLPRLGRVDVSVRHERGAWHVELDPEDAHARVWLGHVRQRCQDRLSADLRQPVYLSLTASNDS
ncbi:flagellar hook-length control protein FliK [Pseudomonas nabeulensis]|uniref:Flagellar hook-length control protein FliK n=1 Tax=Pseudomonas nabeulensis TaxID=2293833 RepID=A0A4Z0B7K3_9PSED|nr:type III secretion system HrpP C-terminal domain-containing protein [Pseudomonas nabeulensis]TFY94986.1 flagellar hook-length control protein FliK [Pseudomonas nabeulensis]